MYTICNTTLIKIVKCFVIAEEDEHGNNTGKKVAIVLGAAAAALSGGFIFLKLMKSRCGKDDDV